MSLQLFPSYLGPNPTLEYKCASPRFHCLSLEDKSEVKINCWQIQGSIFYISIGRAMAITPMSLQYHPAYFPYTYDLNPTWKYKFASPRFKWLDLEDISKVKIKRWWIQVWNTICPLKEQWLSPILLQDHPMRFFYQGYKFNFRKKCASLRFNCSSLED